MQKYIPILLMIIVVGALMGLIAAVLRRALNIGDSAILSGVFGAVTGSICVFIANLMLRRK
jgi:hypothetical protein